jgi:hypothetical protein
MAVDATHGPPREVRGPCVLTESIIAMAKIHDYRSNAASVPLIRCKSSTAECAHVAGLRESVVKVAENTPADELTPALLDACAAALKQADELRRLHLIGRALDNAC